jgi:hypothetical protein
LTSRPADAPTTGGGAEKAHRRRVVSGGVSGTYLIGQCRCGQGPLPSPPRSVMSDVEEFRKQAEDARQMAARSIKQDDKVFWLRLAEDWILSRRPRTKNLVLEAFARVGQEIKRGSRGRATTTQLSFEHAEYDADEAARRRHALRVFFLRYDQDTALRTSNRRRDREMRFALRLYLPRPPTRCIGGRIGDIRGMWSWRLLGKLWVPDRQNTFVFGRVCS